MAAGDASPFPIKNQAYRVTFALKDVNDDLVSGATSPDSEVSKDGGTFTDCTNEATEIATSSGVYFLDLTATEMNADTVAIIVKSGSAKTKEIILYPVTLSEPMLGVNVEKWNDADVLTPNVAGVPRTDVAYMLGGTAITTGLLTFFAFLPAKFNVASPTSTSCKITGGANIPTTPGALVGWTMHVISGTGAGQATLVTAYDHANQIVSFEAMTTDLDTTSDVGFWPLGKADVQRWANILATISATTNLPETDAKSISDNTDAADGVQANIGNLDATVSSRALASVCTEARLAELAAANLPTDVAAIITAIGALHNLDSTAVQAAAAAALVAIHLDHLLAVDYDPASKPGVGTALLNELVENNGGVSRLLANMIAINGNTNAAIRLALSTGQIIPGTVDSTVTPTTTQFECDDITEATAEHFTGRRWLWTTGNLAGQATAITAYSLQGGKGRFTVSEMTEAPANDDTGIII